VVAGRVAARHRRGLSQVGAGVEFAELRPFVPGDQVRHVNWPASARRGQLLVNQRHPERNTGVVLFLDTYAEARDPHGSTLDLTVRAAATLANRYLASKDHVGLIVYGGYLHWLYPASGRTQAWRILDLLLDTQIFHSVAERPIELIPLRMLPPGALILAVTPLLDERGTRALLQLRARGFHLAILALSPAAYTRPARDEIGDLAYRLWLLQRDALKWRYQRLGVPVAEWHRDQPLEASIAELRSVQCRAHRARG
jgi:uncharacterized protein (DUF58 family)